jgi:DNA repair protein RecN (Recombination protein N)
MLKDLRIKNFTIIDDLSVGFEPGLNILTGETGAGKSIIVDALGLILGGKASQDMIKTGRKEAHIEAFFDNTGHPLLKELSIESESGIIMRRTIAAQGKGRTYINDTPVSIQTLSSIGRSLIDIHGQHEHQGLLKKDSHMLFIDNFGNLAASVASVQAMHTEIAGIKNTLVKRNAPSF